MKRVHTGEEHSSIFEPHKKRHLGDVPSPWLHEPSIEAHPDAAGGYNGSTLGPTIDVPHKRPLVAEPEYNRLFHKRPRISVEPELREVDTFVPSSEAIPVETDGMIPTYDPQQMQLVCYTPSPYQKQEPQTILPQEASSSMDELPFGPPIREFLAATSTRHKSDNPFVPIPIPTTMSQQTFPTSPTINVYDIVPYIPPPTLEPGANEESRPTLTQYSSKETPIPETHSDSDDSDAMMMD